MNPNSPQTSRIPAEFPEISLHTGKSFLSRQRAEELRKQQIAATALGEIQKKPITWMHRIIAEQIPREKPEGKGNG